MGVNFWGKGPRATHREVHRKASNGPRGYPEAQKRPNEAAHYQAVFRRLKHSFSCRDHCSKRHGDHPTVKDYMLLRFCCGSGLW